jgi:drug/metabolite transporter (DMT)-like permease
LFAFLVTTVAVAFFQLGAATIGGEKTSILSVLEPITGILIGFVAFDEKIEFSVIAGSVLVIAATALIAISDVRRSTKNQM